MSSLFNQCHVDRYIKWWNPNKVPGRNKVSMAVIEDAVPYILRTLTEIVNRSLMSSVFPSCWKESEVIPLLREGDPEIATNNRPVSLLPAASKVCERIALNQMMTYLEKEEHLTNHQSGNKKLHCRIIEHLDIQHCAGVNGSKTNNSIGSVRSIQGF